LRFAFSRKPLVVAEKTIRTAEDNGIDKAIAQLSEFQKACKTQRKRHRMTNA